MWTTPPPKAECNRAAGCGSCAPSCSTQPFVFTVDRWSTGGPLTSATRKLPPQKTLADAHRWRRLPKSLKLLEVRPTDTSVDARELCKTSYRPRESPLPWTYLLGLPFCVRPGEVKLSPPPSTQRRLVHQSVRQGLGCFGDDRQEGQAPGRRAMGRRAAATRYLSAKRVAATSGRRRLAMVGIVCPKQTVQSVGNSFMVSQTGRL